MSPLFRRYKSSEPEPRPPRKNRNSIDEDEPQLQQGSRILVMRHADISRFNLDANRTETLEGEQLDAELEKLKPSIEELRNFVTFSSGRLAVFHTFTERTFLTAEKVVNSLISIPDVVVNSNVFSYWPEGMDESMILRPDIRKDLFNSAADTTTDTLLVGHEPTLMQLAARNDEELRITGFGQIVNFDLDSGVVTTIADGYKE